MTPAHPAHTPRNGSPRPRLHSSSASKMMKTRASLLRTILEMRDGISVVEAENGEMATALAESLHPDLILMDGSLPLLDGFAATRRIRELASMRDVPIVFLSGHAQPAAEVQAFAAGCADYLVKPFALGELNCVLERYLSQPTADS